MRWRIVAAASLLAAGLWATASAAPATNAVQTPPATVDAQKGVEQTVATTPDHSRIVLKPIPDVSRLDGAELYASLCADCHGATGRGDGRLAAKLGAPIPDLTRLAGEGGTFDPKAVRGSISDKRMVPTPQADPWWTVFTASFGNARGNQMITRLTSYLETLQAQPAEKH